MAKIPCGSKIEASLERAIQQDYLYAIPVFKSPSRRVQKTPVKVLDALKQPSEQTHSPEGCSRAGMAGPKRLVLRGPRPISSSLPRPGRPSRRLNPRINCRYKNPHNGTTTYVCNSKQYECPSGIEPWRADQKWILEPSQGFFKGFASCDGPNNQKYCYTNEDDKRRLR